MMTRACEVTKAVGLLVSVLVVAAAGCDGNKTSLPTGKGGASQGVGGTTGIGGEGGAQPGTGGAAMGTGGRTGAGGNGTGGASAAGTGGDADGGASGSGGRTTLVLGTGGKIAAGTGGRTTLVLGTGGTAAGGTPGLDGGIPATCGDLTTQAACDARSDCHSVFDDPRDCDCLSLGCCARFRACADGDKADCAGTALCEMVEPYCEGPYVVAIRGSCYEGCVKQTDCAPAGCPPSPPVQGTACGRVSMTCYYEDCGGNGRTLAKCTGGTSAWNVTKAACTALTCEFALAVAPAGLICPAGQVCILVDGTGALPPVSTAMCGTNTCGTGPITPGCISDLRGDCTASYSTAGAVFACQLPTP